MTCVLSTCHTSPPRKRGSRATVAVLEPWIPAFAGTTNKFLIFMDSISAQALNCKRSWLRAVAKRRRSSADRFSNGLAYDVDDEARRGNDWRVVYRMRPHPGVHPIRHKPLRVTDDHAVLLRHEKPGRAVFPEWPIHRHRDACRRDRPLNRAEQRQFVSRGILRECRGECLVRQIDQPMLVRRQLWCQRMRLGTIKDIGDSLAFIRSKASDVNKRLHLLIPRSRDHGASIGVPHKNGGSRNSLQCALNGRGILGKRGQGERRREDPDGVGGQRPDDFGPARSVSPSSVHQDNTHILMRHWLSPRAER